MKKINRFTSFLWGNVTRPPGFYFLFFIFQIHSKRVWETVSMCFVGFCICVCIYLSKERKRKGRGGNLISSLFLLIESPIYLSPYTPTSRFRSFSRDISKRKSVMTRLSQTFVNDCAVRLVNSYILLTGVNEFVFWHQIPKNLESWEKTGKIPKVP